MPDGGTRGRVPFHYDIFPEKRLIFQRYSGRFTLAELLAAIEKLWSDPRYDPTFDGLIDLSSDCAPPSMADFRSLLEFVQGSAKTTSGRWAAIAHSPLVTACGLIYKRAMARRHVFEVFSTCDAACAFLGIHCLPEFKAR